MSRCALPQPIARKPGRPARLALVLWTVIALLCSASADAAGAERFHPQRILVRFKPQTTAAAQANAHARAKSLKTPHNFNIVGDLHLTEVAPGAVEDAMRSYKTDPNVLYAEPDFKLKLVGTPNDADFPLLWGMQNTGQAGEGIFCFPESLPSADIRAPKAWDVWTGDPDFRIAVLDTGVDYNHPDLAENIWTNPGETAGDGIDNDGNGYIDDVHGYDFGDDDSDPLDEYFHGTHVSGTIGATGNKGLGVAGVNWRCKIVALKIAHNGAVIFVSDAVEALAYVLTNEIKVSNNSWRL